VNYWPLRQQSNIFVISAKIALSNFGPIIPLVTALSCISAPISPGQQCCLAFISEFNVQLLYLPGLKNVVADFLSRPPPQSSPLDQSPLRRQTQWITKRWPPSKTVAQRRSAFWAAHPSDWLSARQAPNAWLEMLSPSSSEKKFFCIFIMLLTLGGLPCRFILSRFVLRELSSDITAWTGKCLAC
jgi:hypothetical protein